MRREMIFSTSQSSLSTKDLGCNPTKQRHQERDEADPKQCGKDNTQEKS